MKAPPLLVGAALLFWGWQSDFFVLGAVMAVVLESARFVKARWELSDEDFSRIWTFCAVLFLASGAYGFASNNGPASVGGLFTDSGFQARSNVGISSGRTAVLLIRWLPMTFFLFVAAQVFSNREGIPLETISLILQRRWRAARKAGRPAPASRTVNVSYPYFLVTLFAAGAHPVTSNDGFFWVLSALLAWALWTQRSRRFGWALWGGTMGLAILAAYGGQRGLVQLKEALDRYNPDWFMNWRHPQFSPRESRTEIGEIGRSMTSGRIIIRLETTNGIAPAYLREASYRTYRSTVWHEGGSKDNFGYIPEQPINSGNWSLLTDKTNAASVSIASYLPGGKGLLPLPTDCGRLEQLPAFSVEKNNVGAVRVEGPGLVIFNALYGTGATIDFPPDTNEDLAVPDEEKSALDQVLASLHLESATRESKLAGLSRYFASGFAYSLWQERPKVKDTNVTALGRFLLSTHSGHCEYFATATVLLLRELGIPARYTVGYAVHEQSGKKYFVRQSDAHAWCRVWNDRTGSWGDFDTTPGSWLEAERKQRSSFQFLSDGWSRMMFEIFEIPLGTRPPAQVCALGDGPGAAVAAVANRIPQPPAARRSKVECQSGRHGLARVGLGVLSTRKQTGGARAGPTIERIAVRVAAQSGI